MRRIQAGARIRTLCVCVMLGAGWGTEVWSSPHTAAEQHLIRGVAPQSSTPKSHATAKPDSPPVAQPNLVRAQTASPDRGIQQLPFGLQASDTALWYIFGLGAASLFLLVLGILYTRSRVSPVRESLIAPPPLRTEPMPPLGDDVPTTARPIAEPSAQPVKPSSQHAFVEVQDGPPQKVQVVNSPFTIGRRTDRDLTLWDPSVSRKHAEIERINGGFVVMDLDSLNGVYVNNEKISRCVLADADIIELGDVAIRFTLQTEFASIDHENGIEYEEAQYSSNRLSEA